MDYNVVITSDAEKDLDSFIHYLLFEKKNEQAASSVLDDFEKTKQILSVVAGSLNYCANSQLKRLGYKRLNFQHHRYFMLFRLVNNLAIVDNIFHELHTDLTVPISRHGDLSKWAAQGVLLLNSVLTVEAGQFSHA